MEYSYPISIDWSTEETIIVVQFFETIEKVYEKGVKRNKILENYRKFKSVVPSIGEEKRIFRDFEEVSGLSSYKAVKKMKESGEDILIKF